MTTEEKPFDKDRVKVIYQDGRVTGGPTTMTDVDTSEYIEWLDEIDRQFGIKMGPNIDRPRLTCSGAANRLRALAAERNELERLAEAMATAIYRNSEEGCEMGRALDAAMEYTDYQQRKGE